MIRKVEYIVRDFKTLRGLEGIPDALVEAHLRLYAGYVKNINLLRERLLELKPGVPEFSELHRRVGFEINGMRLHELYFDNLFPGRGSPSARLKETIAADWGSFDAW